MLHGDFTAPKLESALFPRPKLAALAGASSQGGKELRWEGLPLPPAPAPLAQLEYGPQGISRRFEESDGNGGLVFFLKGVLFGQKKSLFEVVGFACNHFPCMHPRGIGVVPASDCGSGHCLPDRRSW